MFISVGTLMCLLLVTEVAAEDLPTPCRAYRSPCGAQEFVCNTEEIYQRSQPEIGPQPACPVTSPPAPPPVEDCLLINGSCQFVSNSSVNCRTWLPECEVHYQCGSEEDYTNFLAQEPKTCDSTGDVPPPNAICIPLEGFCQWYNPCRSWQPHCSSTNRCGTLSEYWAFVYGPIPLCFPFDPPPDPPGECIVQNETCVWSNCTAWLEDCQSRWRCGTEFENQQFLALPPHPCPIPGHDFRPPIQPGPCSFNISAGACQFRSCPEGTEYRDYGLQCAGFKHVPGCYCPQYDMVEYQGSCVHPLECPTLPRACPPNVDITCTRNSRCLEISTTGETFCLESCFMDSGGCGEDQVCVTEPPPENCDSPPCSSTTCEDLDESLEATCPPGWVFDQCGSYCQATCDDYLLPLSCPAVCAPGCVCPPGLVAYRDRCVDPQECTALFEDPPPINPLPQFDNTALVELTVTGMSREEFENQQESLLQSVRDLLLNEGYTGVGVTVYAVVEEGQTLQVVLRFKGDDISSQDSRKLNPSEVAALVADNSESLPVEVAEVSAVETPILESTESEDGLSGGAIAGIVVASIVGGTVLVMIVVAVVVAAVVISNKRSKGKAAGEKASASGEETKPEGDAPAAVTYSKLKEFPPTENEYIET